MLYKVILKDKKGKEEIYYMDGDTLKSMKTDAIIDIEKINPPDENWQYEDKVL